MSSFRNGCHAHPFQNLFKKAHSLSTTFDPYQGGGAPEKTRQNASDA